MWYKSVNHSSFFFLIYCLPLLILTGCDWHGDVYLKDSQVDQFNELDNTDTPDDSTGDTDSNETETPISNDDSNSDTNGDLDGDSDSDSDGDSDGDSDSDSDSDSDGDSDSDSDSDSDADSATIPHEQPADTDTAPPIDEDNSWRYITLDVLIDMPYDYETWALGPEELCIFLLSHSYFDANWESFLYPDRITELNLKELANEALASECHDMEDMQDMRAEMNFKWEFVVSFKPDVMRDEEEEPAIFATLFRTGTHSTDLLENEDFFATKGKIDNICALDEAPPRSMSFVSLEPVSWPSTEH